MNTIEEAKALQEKILSKFVPCGAVLLCDPILAAEKTKGGIIIPEQCRNPLSQGRVLGVGDTISAETWPPGSIVMYTQHSESKIKIDGYELVIVPVNDVLMKSV